MSHNEETGNAQRALNLQTACDKLSTAHTDDEVREALAMAKRAIAAVEPPPPAFLKDLPMASIKPYPLKTFVLVAAERFVQATLGVAALQRSEGYWFHPPVVGLSADRRALSARVVVDTPRGRALTSTATLDLIGVEVASRRAVQMRILQDAIDALFSRVFDELRARGPTSPSDVPPLRGTY